MSASLDINHDIKVTNNLLLNKAHVTKNDTSWLNHSEKAGVIDYAVLKGASMTELITLTGQPKERMKNHFYHLKTVHGVIVEEQNGIYKITGTIDPSSLNEELHKLKDQFLAEWPISRLQSMRIDEYTNLDKTSFCYWLEHITRDLGSIVGGSSYKFGIYKRNVTTDISNDTNRATDGEYAWFKKYGETREEAFETIRSLIITIAQSSIKNELENIDDIDLGHAYKWKIAFLYGDYNCINAFKLDALRVIASNLSITYTKNTPVSEFNREILKLKPEQTDYYIYTDKLWKQYESSLNDKTNYWVYSPGQNAEHWDSFYENGIMAIGWNDLGDLSQYETKEDVLNGLKKAYDVSGNSMNNVAANFEFANEIQVGDIIIAKRGRGELLGYGEVTSDYYYDPNEVFHSCRSVDWKLNGHWDTNHSLVLKTLTNITQYDGEKEGFDKYYNYLLAIMNGEVPHKTNNVMNVKAKNKILYGPPGTGKTFYLKDQLFDQYTVKETSISDEKNFETTVSNLTWWQVIALALLEIGTARVNDILANRWVSKKASLSESKNVRATLWGTLQMHTIIESKNVAYTQRQAPFIFDKNEDKSWSLLDAELAEQAPELNSILDDVNNFEARPDIVIENYVFVTFHQSFAYEDFIEGIKPIIPETDVDVEESKDLGFTIEDGVFKKLCKRAKIDPDNRYAIFIDEINRGNVSAIFGELITLIEVDKRAGAENQMSIKLPYSKKEFSVPANVDIYGTMNTADRSVEALDTALRRRFEFKEMMPNESLIDDRFVDTIQLSKVLRTINQRIELLLDRDHTIGHSYFMSVNTAEDLANAFNNKIVPLLQEYFYGDYGKIGLVLGNGFVEINENKSVSFSSFKYEDKDQFINPAYTLKLIDESNIIDAINQLLETKEA